MRIRRGIHWNKKQLQEMYWGENKSTVKIAEELALSKSLILFAMQELGIPRRSHSKAMKLHFKNNRGNAWKGGRSVDSNGYVKIWLPSHPYADHRGYVMEHRLVMEKKLGRYLMPWEKVHHLDGVKNHNTEKNLQVLSPTDHNIAEAICKNCPVRKEVRLLRWQVKQLQEQLQYRLEAR